MSQGVLVYDKNIPFVDLSIKGIDLLGLSPENITNDRLIREGATALLVRTVTKINHNLLNDTLIRWVGSATSGIDHVDVDYLRARNIAFKSALGCNKQAVVDYVFSACALHALQNEYLLSDKVLCIVGYGNIGRAMLERGQDLFKEVLIVDPFQSCHFARQMTLKEAVRQSDIVTFHVPLTTGLNHPTLNMVDQDLLNEFKPDCLFINTCRGEIITAEHLKNALLNGIFKDVIIDVWADEPNIDMALYAKAFIATSHIAGYSVNGKINATRMTCQSLAETFGLVFSNDALLQHAKNKMQIKVSRPVATPDLYRLLLDAYPIDRDARQMREGLRTEDAEIPAAFKRLRSQYVLRSEMSSVDIDVDTSAQGQAVEKVLGIVRQ